MMSATGPKNLRLAGALADIVQLQVGTHPDAIRWALQYVREGAEEAERDLDEIEEWLTEPAERVPTPPTAKRKKGGK